MPFFLPLVTKEDSSYVRAEDKLHRVIRKSIGPVIRQFLQSAVFGLLRMAAMPVAHLYLRDPRRDSNPTQPVFVDAKNDWLDRWGEVFGITRYKDSSYGKENLFLVTDKDDDVFRARIISNAFTRNNTLPNNLVQIATDIYLKYTGNAITPDYVFGGDKVARRDQLGYADTLNYQQIEKSMDPDFTQINVSGVSSFEYATGNPLFTSGLAYRYSGFLIYMNAAYNPLVDAEIRKAFSFVVPAGVCWDLSWIGSIEPGLSSPNKVPGRNAQPFKQWKKLQNGVLTETGLSVTLYNETLSRFESN